MKTRNLSGVWIIFAILILFWVLADSGSPTTGTPSNSAIYNSTLGVYTTPTPQDLWRLAQFENKEDTGLPYDRGLFVNDRTGEQFWAQCLDPEAADPFPGDTFTKSGDYFSPTSGKGQSFQAFLVLTVTPTLIQVTPTLTAVATLQTPQSVMPETTGKSTGPLDICWSLAVLAVIAALFFFGARYLWRYQGRSQ